MKIIIVGGLGYIGSALIEQYRHDPGHDILIVDRAFIPERIANLPEHVDYIQGDMQDLDLMARLVSDADILYLLAAEVEAESSINREESIWRSNFEWPRAIIEACASSTRVFFPSSGNVFGGVDESSKYLGLSEEDEPVPKYPYAESKREMEKFLLGSGREFVLVRFGTNYGFAPAMRFNLVTNIFTRRALLSEPITIHGDGSNYRPTACVNDCARALCFLSMRSDVTGEIFHVVNESVQIRELAEKVIAAVDSQSRMEFISKEVPFSAYGLSSEKIRSLGFDFKWDIKHAVQDVKRVFRGMRHSEDLHAA